MVFAVRAADAELTPYGPEPDSVLAGDLVTSNVVLTSDDTVKYGIWQITPGTSVQVATAGMFVVLVRPQGIDGGRHEPRPVRPIMNHDRVKPCSDQRPGAEGCR
jgi:hypothetical protein